jgi:cell pole-organizing protein PopZ
MTQAAKSQEPSMEEILASIRRIIADDDASKTVQKPADPPPPPKAESRPAPPPQPAPPPAAFVPPPPTPPRPRVEPEPVPAMTMPSADMGPPEQPTDILDLTEAMAAAMPPPPQQPPAQFRTIDGSSDVDFAEPVERPAAEDRGRLMSTATSAAVDNAFNTLAQTVLMQNARTLEDLVREMLRPMLKSWLDDNLPSMVERLVRSEIERVSRGRTG